MKNEHLLPGSVVLGAVIIGAGLYFGLRERPIVIAPPATTSAPPTGAPAPDARPSLPADTGSGAPAAAPQIPMVPGVGLAPPAVPAAVLAKAEADAKEALARNKKDVLLPKCWAPSVKASADPPKVQLQLSLSFGADGTQIGRGVHETRGAARADVTACLERQPLDLKISPPGTTVNLMVPLELP